MEPSEIVEWALARGFRPTGTNAYSTWYEGAEYQILLRRDGYRLNRKPPGSTIQHQSKTDFDGLHIDEFGMLQGGSLAEAFVRKYWRDGRPVPPWFTPEYTEHALKEMIPEWEAKIASFSPRP